MKYLVTGDTHFSDRPRDAYRFGLFGWLNKMKRQHKADAIIILGDLTDKKDKHSAVLVNNIVKELTRLEPPVYILMGNHDAIDLHNPFFGFINEFASDILFITKPTTVAYDKVFFIPFMRSEANFKEACANEAAGAGKDYVFIHQTMDGVISENGSRLSGFSTAPITKLKPRYGCYAGDIHKPQRVGPVTYVGAPYTVRFGDNFEPRVLLLEDGRETDLYYECPRKWSLTVRGPEDIAANKKLFPGDQIKLTIEMVREEAVEWRTVKAAVLHACRAAGLVVFGVDLKVNSLAPRRERINKTTAAPNVLNAFCKAENLPDQVRTVGMGLLECSNS